MMASLDEEITALKASITRYESMLEKVETSEERKDLIFAAIIESKKTLNIFLGQKSQQGK